MYAIWIKKQLSSNCIGSCHSHFTRIWTIRKKTWLITVVEHILSRRLVLERYFNLMPFKTREDIELGNVLTLFTLSVVLYFSSSSCSITICCIISGPHFLISKGITHMHSFSSSKIFPITSAWNSKIYK